MTERSEGIDWEGGWRSPRPAESQAQPRPEHDIDTADVIPSNSEPASSINPRRMGAIVTGPHRPSDWD